MKTLEVSQQVKSLPIPRFLFNKLQQRLLGGDSEMSVLDQIPGFVKGAGLGIGATALTAIVAMSSSKDLKPLVSHPLFWIFGPGVGAVAFSWNEWGRRDGSTSTSTSASLLPTTSTSLPISTSGKYFHTSDGHFHNEGSGVEVHPVYAQTTEGIRQHIFHFTPGSEEFREELKNGKEFLGHVAIVYHPALPPTTSTAEVPRSGWQTVTTTHGEFDDHRSASAALPPSHQAPVNAQPKTSVPAEDLQPIPSTEDDWTAEWAAVQATAPEEDQKALQPAGSNGSSDGDDYWGE